MRQTPFGVWNGGGQRDGHRLRIAPMRQTPFGVWNPVAPRVPCSPLARSNEADAFRRLEYVHKAGVYRDETLLQ